MQLLEITTVPAKYELEIEHARLEMRQDFQPSADVTQEYARLHLKTQPAELHIDTYEARKSLGFASAKDIIYNGARKGAQSIQDKTRQYVEQGKQMAQIEKGIHVTDIVKREQSSKLNPPLQTVFLPSASAEISYQEGSLHTSFDEGELEYNWDIMKNVMNYVPGSVRMKILEYPRVEIKYVGSPLYIPPSSDPNYVEPEE